MTSFIAYRTNYALFVCHVHVTCIHVGLQRTVIYTCKTYTIAHALPALLAKWTRLVASALHAIVIVHRMLYCSHYRPNLLVQISMHYGVTKFADFVLVWIMHQLFKPKCFILLLCQLLNKTFTCRCRIDSQLSGCIRIN